MDNELNEQQLPADAVEQPEAQEHDEYETEASLQGWVPKEKYRGNPEEWRPAKEFVERGREINSILRANNARLTKRLEVLEQERQSFQAQIDELKQTTYKKDAESYEDRVASMKKARRQAMVDGDMERALELEDQLEDMQARRPAKPDVKASNQPAPVDPALQQWMDVRPWFGQDKLRTDIAMAVGQAISSENPTLHGDAFLRELDTRLADEYPKQFAPRRKPRADVVTGGQPSGPSRARTRTKADLPADARAAMENFMRNGMIKSEDDYLSRYSWDD